MNIRASGRRLAMKAVVTRWPAYIFGGAVTAAALAHWFIHPVVDWAFGLTLSLGLGVPFSREVGAVLRAHRFAAPEEGRS